MLSLAAEAKELIKSILVKNPHTRPSIPEILKHTWFIKIIPPSLGHSAGTPPPSASTHASNNMMVPINSMSTVAEDPASSSFSGGSRSPSRSSSAALRSFTEVKPSTMTDLFHRAEEISRVPVGASRAA